MRAARGSSASCADIDVLFSHDSWRGLVRACNGVFTMPPETLPAFDAELAELLAGRYAEPLSLAHRVFGILGRKP